ncbi:MAG TPA: hypothetical protein VJI46_00430 [Candidatus Nanoarchaeia archaeon]|nr:hypothetical protein [Candidatus Nanoarchaeia archaeon]
MAFDILFIEGVLKISNVVLALIAGLIAISMFALPSKDEALRPWKVLVFVLLFFAVQEILGALRAFQIYESPFLTHVVPTIILGLLIRALILQQNLNLGKAK